MLINLKMLTHPYTYISDEMKGKGRDIFVTRLLMKRTICLTGSDAAEFFYDENNFQRKGAAPRRLRKTLLGEKGVQGLDGEAHRKRKMFFMSLLGSAQIFKLLEIFNKRWEEKISKWERLKNISLMDELHELLFESVCEWLSVPVESQEVKLRANDMVKMIEGAGSPLIGYLQGKKARVRSEKWIKRLILRVRSHDLKLSEDDIFHKLVFNLDTSLCDPEVMAVEVLNIIRPTVAVARYITFAAHAIHIYNIDPLKMNDPFYRVWFIHEVRRYYPFFPFVVAKAKTSLERYGVKINKGDRVLLDLYGTNRDPFLWDHPDAFDPERFRLWDGNEYELIPQGGGNHFRHHRCAGEGVTIELMKIALDNLTQKMTYEIPEQDLKIKVSTAPANIDNGLLLTNIKRRDEYGGRYRDGYTQPLGT